MAAWIVGATMAVSAALIQIPFIAGVLHLQPLHLDDWILVLVGTAIPALVLLIRR
jgi:Ca2+-transporting ATPase